MLINTDICLKFKLDGIPEESNKQRKMWKYHVIQWLKIVWHNPTGWLISGRLKRSWEQQFYTNASTTVPNHLPCLYHFLNTVFHQSHKDVKFLLQMTQIRFSHVWMCPDSKPELTHRWNRNIRCYLSQQYGKLLIHVPEIQLHVEGWHPTPTSIQWQIQLTMLSFNSYLYLSADMHWDWRSGAFY
jgi:hypothetical protein